MNSAEQLEQPGLATFFVRREVLATRLQKEIAITLDRSGFELHRIIDLDPDQINTVTRMARGANWGSGGLPVSGGPPAQLIFAYDVLPLSVTADVRKRCPFVDNHNIVLAKLRCRELIRVRMSGDRQFHPVEATNDSVEAWEFVRALAPEEELGLRSLIEVRRASFATSYDVVRDLTRKGNRAKIEVIRYGGRLAVKKTFRENCLKYMEREVSFLDAVSPRRREILPVLERGTNYFITPFVDGMPLRRTLLGRGFPKLMTLQQVRDAANLLHFLFSNGYDPIDLAPHNLIVHSSGQLTAIDFELVRWQAMPVDPERSACLRGRSDVLGGELPRGRLLRTDPYRVGWSPYTGLPLRSFLRDPAWLQALKRVVYHPSSLMRRAIYHQCRWLRSRGKRN